jgi:sugar phosphate isomerase/epimerase
MTAQLRASQLGVQAHCLRFKISEQGLEASLAELAGQSFQLIEMVSFSGCRGNRWGDFGSATDLPATRVASALRDAGLACPSIHVTATELSAKQLEATLNWARTIGIQTIVLSSLAPTPAGAGINVRLPQIHELNVIGKRLRAEGFRFALHMQPDLWQAVDGTVVADELSKVLDTSLCQLEFDPSGCVVFGADPADYLASHPGAFFAVHLRDGMRPVAPQAYLEALPLGEGNVDWNRLFRAAANSAVSYYFLEMEVARAGETMAAIDTSIQFLRREGLLSGAHPSDDHPLAD